MVQIQPGLPNSSYGGIGRHKRLKISRSKIVSVRVRLGAPIILEIQLITDLKVFKYKDQWHLRIFPAKRLLNSETLYQIVTRGDIIALNLHTFRFTVVDGKSNPEHKDAYIKVYE